MKLNEERQATITYYRQHTNFCDPQTPSSLLNTNIITEEEKVSIQLVPYERDLTFRPLSYIHVSNSIEQLYKELNDRHLELKGPPKNKRNRRMKEKSSLSIINEKIIEAVKYVHSGFSRKNICSLYGIKPSQLKSAIQKDREGKYPGIEKQGRKSKIQLRFLDFLQHLLSDPKNGVHSLYT